MISRLMFKPHITCLSTDILIQNGKTLTTDTLVNKSLTNGSEVYCIDTSECYLYDEENKTLIKTKVNSDIFIDGEITPESINIINNKVDNFIDDVNERIEQSDINKIVELSDTIGDEDMGVTATTLKGAIAEHSTRLNEKVYYFETIYDMKNANLKVGDLVKTKGYYDANDYGDGWYEILSDLSLVDDGGSVHAIGNGLFAKLIVEPNRINPKQFGAKGDNVTDDSEAIQKSIDFIFKIIKNDNYKGKIHNLNFFAGNYRITSQLVIPFSVHIKTIGSVNIYSEIANDSAIFYDASNDLYCDGYEDDLYREKTLGDLIDASNGGLSIINNLSTVYYKGYFDIGDPQNAIGLEIGVREKDTTNALNKIQTGIICNNIRIERFSIALQLNSINAYIYEFNNFNLTRNEVAVKHGGISKKTNSGENIKYNNCNISNNKVAFIIDENGFSFTINDSSLDYNILTFLDLKTNSGETININNCWIEGSYCHDNVPSNITLYDNNDLYYGIYYNDKASTFMETNIIFNNTNLVFTHDFTQLIHQSAGNRTVATFNNTTLIAIPEISHSLYKDTCLFICADDIYCKVNGVNYVEMRNAPFISKSNNMNANARFDKYEVGYSATGDSIDFGEHYKISYGFNMSNFEIINSDDSNIEVKMLKISFDKNTSTKKEFRITTSKFIHTTMNAPVLINYTIKATGTLALEYGFYCYDSDGNELGKVSNYKVMSVNGYLTQKDKHFMPALQGTIKTKPYIYIYNTDSTTGEIYLTNIYIFQY